MDGGRRRTLIAIAAGVGLAGCSEATTGDPTGDGSPDGLGGTTQPTPTDGATATGTDGRPTDGTPGATTGITRGRTETTGEPADRELLVKGSGSYGLVGDDERIVEVRLPLGITRETDRVDLSAVTVDLDGPDGSATLTYGRTAEAESGTFGVSAYKDADDSAPVLNDVRDRAEVTVALSEAAATLQPLDPGEGTTLGVTTASGARIELRLAVPERLGDEEPGEAVAL